MAWYKCSGGGEGIPLITKSGSIVTFEDSVGGVPINDLVAEITPIQASGTPSPTNVLPISGHNVGCIGCVDFNQIIKNGDLSNGTTDWSGNNSSTISASDGVLTMNWVAQYAQTNQSTISFVKGHTYLLKFDIKADSNYSSINVYTSTSEYFIGSFPIETTWKTAYSIKQYSKATGATTLRFQDNRTSGDRTYFRNIMLFDLTQMFGALVESITTNIFDSLFYKAYYSYTTGGTFVSVNSVNGDNNIPNASVDFGQTIYGGTWKASQGKVVDVPIKVKFSDIPQANWRYSNNSGNWNSYLFFTDLSMRARVTTGLSNVYNYQPNTSEANVSNNSYVLPSWNTYVYIRDDAITSIADFLQAHGDDYIIMKPATQTDISVEPVLMETIEGENKVFANTGNLTAKFYKSTVSNLDTLVEQTKDLAPDLLALASAGDGSTTRVGFDLTEDTTWTKSTRIQNYLFYKNINVEKIDLPSVLEVGEYAFEDAKYIKGINLPNCTTLKREAFYNACQKHTSSTLPSVTINLPSVTVINDRALGQVGYNNGLPATLILTSCQEIKANGARGMGSAYMRINELLLPALVSIGGDAMDYHVFGTVDIGQDCTSIGNKPFNYCTIDTLIIRATTPPSLNSGGLGCTPTRIKVPSASVETYKTASAWSTYASVIEAI